VLRDILTHYDATIVQSITIVEIDPMVIDVARKFFDAGCYFDDERVSVVNADAATFLEGRQHDDIQYSVIIADTSDPVGPAKILFQRDFYQNVYRALATGGVACLQAECYWLHLDWIQDRMACCRDIFDSVEYATTSVPSYPCGQIGFIMARKGNNGRCSCQTPLRRPAQERRKLAWYSPELHRASFVLPAFVMERLNGDNKQSDNDNLISDIKQEGSVLQRNTPGTNNADHVHRCFMGDGIEYIPFWTKLFVTGSKNAISDIKNDNQDEEGQHECFFKLPVQCRNM
jgi:spermidine synthase